MIEARGSWRSRGRGVVQRAVTFALLTPGVAVLLMVITMLNTALLRAESALIVFAGTLGNTSRIASLSTLGSRVRSRAVLLPPLSRPLPALLTIAAVRATGDAPAER